MKTIHITAAVMAVTSTAAFGQSTVTLYGVIDEGVEYVSNVKVSPGVGKSLYQLDSVSGLQGSRWGCEAPRTSVADSRPFEFLRTALTRTPASWGKEVTSSDAKRMWASQVPTVP